MDMREMFTIDGRRFSNMAGFYDEVEQVFICGLDWKIGRNLNAFNDILRGGFGRHEYGQPIHIQWLAYEKSVRNLGKETMDTIVEIILDTDHSGHDCNPIQDGETIDGVADGQMSREIQWKCQYEDALIQPPREVLDIHMGKYASGGR